MTEIIDDQIIKDNGDLVQASNTQRFINYIVDSIAIFAVLFLFLSFIPVGNSQDELLFNVIFLVSYVLYGTLLEFTLGKTIGKFITKTNVVNADGFRPSFLNTLGRNFARLIPFDNLSFLFASRGWHDSVSNTYVVKD